MTITENSLRQIIRECVENVLLESGDTPLIQFNYGRLAARQETYNTDVAKETQKYAKMQYNKDPEGKNFQRTKIYGGDTDDAIATGIYKVAYEQGYNVQKELQKATDEYNRLWYRVKNSDNKSREDAVTLNKLAERISAIRKKIKKYSHDYHTHYSENGVKNFEKARKNYARQNYKV